MATVSEHRVSYLTETKIEHSALGPNLVFSTADPAISGFFQGRFRSPRRAADLLLCLNQFVASRFYTPPAMVARLIRQADPVITCGLDRLRWEGFSACCSAYARVDMRPNALDGALLNQGTTNVDFGPEMRTLLTRMASDSNCTVSIGRQGIEVTSESTVSERVVKLPTRWLRGFLEANYHQLSLQPQFLIKGPEIRRFLQGLPRSSGRSHGFLTKAGNGLRLSFSPSPYRFNGWERLRPLDSLLIHAHTLVVYWAKTGATAWRLETEDASFTLVLSPDVWRGFSGEGQALWLLSQESDADQDQKLLAKLGWEASIDPDKVAQQTGFDRFTVDQGLARFAALGLVGFDLNSRSFFRRHLPYDSRQIEALNPRLRSARQLVEAAAVTWEGTTAWVKSGDVSYRVSWSEEEPTCSCPWFATHGQERGMCKHILAATFMENVK